MNMKFQWDEQFTQPAQDFATVCSHARETTHDGGDKPQNQGHVLERRPPAELNSAKVHSCSLEKIHKRIKSGYHGRHGVDQPGTDEFMMDFAAIYSGWFLSHRCLIYPLVI